MRTRDGDLAGENEGRHAGNPELAHLLVERNDLRRGFSTGPAGHAATLCDCSKGFGVTDILRVLELGAEQRVHHGVASALLLR